MSEPEKARPQPEVTGGCGACHARLGAGHWQSHRGAMPVSRCSTTPARDARPSGESESAAQATAHFQLYLPPPPLAAGRNSGSSCNIAAPLAALDCAALSSHFGAPPPLVPSCALAEGVRLARQAGAHPPSALTSASAHWLELTAAAALPSPSPAAAADAFALDSCLARFSTTRSSLRAGSFITCHKAGTSGWGVGGPETARVAH